MKWIKKVIIDILVSVTILVAVLNDQRWLEVIVVVYSSVLLVIKLLLLLSPAKSLKGCKLLTQNVPILFYHLIFGFNVLVLLIFQWWFSSLLWMMIWFISWMIENKQNQQRKPQKRKKHK